MIAQLMDSGAIQGGALVILGMVLLKVLEMLKHYVISGKKSFPKSNGRAGEATVSWWKDWFKDLAEKHRKELEDEFDKTRHVLYEMRQAQRDLLVFVNDQLKPLVRRVDIMINFMERNLKDTEAGNSPTKRGKR